MCLCDNIMSMVTRGGGGVPPPVTEAQGRLVGWCGGCNSPGCLAWYAKWYCNLGPEREWRWVGLKCTREGLDCAMIGPGRGRPAYVHARYP